MAIILNTFKDFEISQIRSYLKSIFTASSISITVKTVILSGILSAGVKAIAFSRELVVAFYFGVSETIDNYVMVILTVTFFVGPISGSLSTLITPRYIQFIDKRQISKAASLLKKSLLISIFFIVLIEILQFFLIKFLPLNGISGLNLLFESYWIALVPVALFSSISVVTGGVLVGQGRVKAYTCLPAIVSITVIASLVLFSSTNLYMALIFGTMAGFAFEMLANLTTVRKLLLISHHSLRSTADDFRGMLAKMPMLVGSAIIMNACIIVDQVMAVMAGPGSVAAVSFGSRLSLGLISITAVIWVVLYPVFSRLVSQKGFNQLRQQLFQNVVLVLVLGVPICSLIAYFSPEITRLLFERGEFDSAATEIVSEIQMFYVLHIPLYVVVMVCMRVANAFQNNSYIMVANLISLALNVIFNLLFIEWMGVAGIALATLVAYSFMVVFWLMLANRLITNHHQT